MFPPLHPARPKAHVASTVQVAPASSRLRPCRNLKSPTFQGLLQSCVPRSSARRRSGMELPHDKAPIVTVKDGASTTLPRRLPFESSLLALRAVAGPTRAMTAARCSPFRQSVTCGDHAPSGPVRRNRRREACVGSGTVLGTRASIRGESTHEQRPATRPAHSSNVLAC